MARREPEPTAAFRHPLLTAGLALCSGGLLLACHTAPQASFTLPKFVLLSIGVLTASVGAALSSAAGAMAPGRRPLDLPVAGVLAVLTVSTLASQDRFLSLFGMYNYYAYGLWGAALYAALAILASRAAKAAAPVIIAAALVSGAAAGLYGALQFLGYEPFPRLGVVLTGRRAIATMGSPVSLGAALGMLAPQALYAVWERRNSLWSWACALLIAGGLAASGSRAGMLGAAAGMIFYVSLSGRIDLRGRWKLWSFLLASLAALAIFRTAGRLASRQDSARGEIWKTAVVAFLEHPFLGSGPDTFELSFRRLKTQAYVASATEVEYQAHAHNDVLQALATTGLAGVAAYLWLLVVGCLTAARVLRDPDCRTLASALAGSLLALFVSMKFNPAPLEALAPAAVYAGLLAGLAPAAAPAGRPWLWWGLSAAAGALTLGAARLVAADVSVKRAQVLAAVGRPELAQLALERALKGHPCETTYQVAYINHLLKRAGGMTEPALQDDLLTRAAGCADKALACRPGYSLPHFAAGVVALTQARAGRSDRLSAAERELDFAMGLDPNFVPVLTSRRDAASLRGDRKLEKRLSARIAHLLKLAQRP